MEKKNWTGPQDNILRHLRETRQVKKWSEVARILAEEYQIRGFNGKDCRER